MVCTAFQAVSPPRACTLRSTSWLALIGGRDGDLGAVVAAVAGGEFLTVVVDLAVAANAFSASVRHPNPQSSVPRKVALFNIECSLQCARQPRVPLNFMPQVWPKRRAFPVDPMSEAYPDSCRNL